MSEHIKPEVQHISEHPDMFFDCLATMSLARLEFHRTLAERRIRLH